LVTSNETKSFSGIAGLAQIPGLGAALRKNDRQKSEGQTLLVLRPRIVGFGASEYVARDIWVGTETRPLPAI
jgi:type II secretory pathway component GspD/PulD (secretin)